MQTQTVPRQHRPSRLEPSQPRAAAKAAVRRTADAGPHTWSGPDYYGLPAVKHSHYKWRTATAFFAEGIAAGSQIAATMIDFAGRSEDQPLVRNGRYLAVAGAAIAPAMLASSMHTPSRWYNILRIFRPTAPISIGSWALTGFGVLSGLSAAGRLLRRNGRPRFARMQEKAFAAAALIPGAVTASYIGTELEETSTPFWASSYPLLSPFLAGAGFADAGAALTLLNEISTVPEATKRRLDYFTFSSGAVQMAFAYLLDQRWQVRPESAAFRKSNWSVAWRGFLAADLLALAARIMALRSKTAQRQYRLFSSAAKLIGGLGLRHVLVYSGRESGRHPGDYLAFTAAPPEQNRALSRLPARESRRPNVPAVREKVGKPSAVWTIGLFSLVIGVAVYGMLQKEGT